LIANLHELYNYLNKEIKNQYTKKTLEENYSKILTTMIPIIPHFAMECIESNKFKLNQLWPTYDESLLEEKEVNYVVQINGKKRALIKITKDWDEKKVLDNIKSDENIVKYLSNKKIKKTIFVQNRLINIII
jgi:leucyl-tRNA synthetase